MCKVIVLCFLLYQAAFIPSATGQDSEEDSETEADLNRIISFLIPTQNDNLLRSRSERKEQKIEMRLGEINDIFDKNKHTIKLSRSDKRKARDCRKKRQIFSMDDNKCYNPISEGPCKNNKWFVAVKGKLGGVCKRRECTSVEAPILFKGTCSNLYGKCPKSSRLYLNKRGVGFCDCDEGFSYNIADDTCHRERVQGPCTDQQIWKRTKAPKNHKTGHKIFGKCKKNKCEEGEAKWKDQKCYKVDRGDIFNKCLESQNGELVIEAGMMTCKMVLTGQGEVAGVRSSCRHGDAWSFDRNKCIRVYLNSG
eukprot:GFUD01010390.1.p1 GENE.GFUD01010390.1~~GFUD01010390.1.p1  ORF type:complete len:342 (+),score=71.73 GFUD01010390.1:104-1027(+)